MKKGAKKSAPGGAGKERHRKTARDIDRSAPLPRGLVARKEVPKTKHQTYFELVDNEDFKRKPLEFERTTQRKPPPLFTFVPLGNPELTTKCKDKSRDQGAMVYIVSTPNGANTDLAQQMNRVGYHFRSQIVQDAMRQLKMEDMHQPLLTATGVEVIPRSQQEISIQADAAMRELFPRIPHTDRAEIIAHAFKKGNISNGEAVVGLQTGLSLSRRVQLAVLAHIRHRHTRYDQLLKETSWANARRVTEGVCLDYLVKWRGDDENGRDQLDEILREVVVLSDDESGGDDSDEDFGMDSSDGILQSNRLITPTLAAGSVSSGAPQAGSQHVVLPIKTPERHAGPKGKSRKAANRERRKTQRSFKRYEAAWDEAVSRQRAASEARRVPVFDPSTIPSSIQGSSLQAPSTPPAASFAEQPLHRGNNNLIPLDGLHGRATHFMDGASNFNGALSSFPPASQFERSAHGSPGHRQLHRREVTPHNFHALTHAPNWPAPGQPALQDLLHPSVEPSSPNAPHSNARGHSHHEPHPPLRPSHYFHHNPASLQDIVVIREGGHAVPQKTTADYAGAPREGGQRYVGGLPPAEHLRLGSRPNRPKQFSPVYRSTMPDERHSWTNGQSGITNMATSGVNTSRLGQHVHPYPKDMPGSGQDTQDRYGHDYEVVEARRPPHDVVYFDERPRAPAAPEAFIRIREQPYPPHAQRLRGEESLVRPSKPPAVVRQPEAFISEIYETRSTLPNHHQQHMPSRRGPYMRAPPPAQSRPQYKAWPGNSSTEHTRADYAYPEHARHYPSEPATDFLPIDGRARQVPFAHPERIMHELQSDERLAPQTPYRPRQEVIVIDS